MVFIPVIFSFVCLQFSKPSPLNKKKKEKKSLSYLLSLDIKPSIGDVLLKEKIDTFFFFFSVELVCIWLFVI